jgi:hypothetical protein
MNARTAGRVFRPFCLAGLFLVAGATASLAFDDAELRAIVGNTRPVEANPDAPGLWMARQRTVEIDGVGNAVITEHLLARVLDPAWGRARFSPYRRLFWAEYTGLAARARIWRSRTESTPVPADSIRIEDAPEGEGKGGIYGNLRACRISVPSMERGDVLELTLRWNCPIPPYDRNVRWVEETFGAEDPVVEQQLVIITPAAMAVDTLSIGPRLHASTAWTDGMRTYRWITGNLPPVPARFLETPWARVPVPPDSVGAGVSRVLFSTLGTWSFAGAYFGSQWEDSWNRRSSDIDRLVRTALGKEQEPRARALALASAVQKEIRTLPVPDLLLGMWPPAASLVAVQRAGGTRDKTLLLVTALRSAGVEASPVLVRERRDAWSERVPSLAQFDRWVVRARPRGSDELWLNPVSPDAAIPPGRGLLFTGPQDLPALQQEAGLIDFPGIPAQGNAPEK